jgi:hypothetical protein
MNEANPIAFSPLTAHTAFDPPCSKRAIKAALRTGELAAHRIGVRAYVLRDDLVAWVSRQKDTRA